MFHMISCFNLKSGEDIETFRSAYSAFVDEMKAINLVEHSGPIGRRQNDTPIPECHAAEFDRDSGDFVLLMEDLSAARQGDWNQDPIADIRTSLAHLAQMHAQFWGDARSAKTGICRRPSTRRSRKPVPSKLNPGMD